MTKATAILTSLFLACCCCCCCRVSDGLSVDVRTRQPRQRSATPSRISNSIPLPDATTAKNTAATTTTTTRLHAQSSDDESLYNAFGAEVVPDGQRPVNEYMNMKSSPMFGWGTNEVGLNGLMLRLGIVYAVTFALVGFPIAGATYTQDGYLLQKIAASNVGSLGFVLVVLIRIYSGWGYAGSRLRSKTIEYEETGWYDGNIEKKTELELKRDKFLYNSDVRPAIDRLKLVTLGCAALWVASCVGLNAANSIKPTFNEYDPRVLNRVVQDENYANAAAKASNGRPTYCDNRYYRAVANGGQGCGN